MTEDEDPNIPVLTELAELTCRIMKLHPPEKHLIVVQDVTDARRAKERTKAIAFSIRQDTSDWRAKLESVLPTYLRKRKIADLDIRVNTRAYRLVAAKIPEVECGPERQAVLAEKLARMFCSADCVEHLQAVANSVGASATERAMAWLHDMVEEGSIIRPEHLLDWGVHPDVVAAASLLARRPMDMPYAKRIRMLAQLEGRQGDRVRNVARACLRDGIEQSVGWEQDCYELALELLEPVIVRSEDRASIN